MPRRSDPIFPLVGREAEKGIGIGRIRFMSPQDDVYVIQEDELLDSVKRLERSAAKAGNSGLRGLDATLRSVGRRPRGAGAGAGVASSLSLFLCGAGQVANGQWKLGLLLFLTEALAV